MKLAKPFTGILAFIIVLLTMPLGHSIMILMEGTFGHEHVYKAAILMGIAGVVILIWGSVIFNDNKATFAGLFVGLFIWTGWIEFAHVYIANRYNVLPLMENGEVVTKPEYLILPASVGFLATFILYHLFNSRTGCTFFTWIQNTFNIPVKYTKTTNQNKNFALITAIELIMLLWTFYLVLLFAYDNSLFGDRHIVTYIIAFGSLLWSGILFRNLLKITKLGYAVRYSIPTVIIFWNFIEILGRWNVLREIWVEPYEFWLEILLIFIVFVALTIVFIFSEKLSAKQIKAS